MEGLHDAIANKSIIQPIDDNGNTLNLGAHFSNIGGELVKDMHLTGRIRKLESHELIDIRFKLTHIYRERVQAVIDEYKDFNPQELALFFKFTGLSEGFKLSSEPFEYYSNKNGVDTPDVFTEGMHAHHLKFPGLGQVQIGAQKDVVGQYKNVAAIVDGNASAEDLHMLLSLTGMSKAMVPSTAMETLRLKLGMLYYTFRPSKAIPLQRSKDFFELPITELKERMVENDPKMAQIIHERLPKMEQTEVMPGWLQLSIPGVAQEVINKGGALLTHTISGSNKIERVLPILNIGLHPTNTRYDGGHKIEGMSCSADIRSGGSDAVFSRLVSDDSTKDTSIHTDNAGDTISLLIALQSLERGSYQYNSDQYGAKGESRAYLHHPSIVEFTEAEAKYNSYTNEVMLNGVVPPREIKAIVVTNHIVKQRIIANMIKAGLAILQNNKHFFRGQDLDSFLFTESQMQEAYTNARR